MKRNIIIFLIIATLLPIQASFAADVKNVGTTLKACAVTYATAMPAFFQTVVSAEGFVENFLAYFVDIVSRSACQVKEIMALDSQLDAINKQIQKAYLECKEEKIRPLEKKYIQTKAEIYYIRHIVNTSGDLESIVGDVDVTVEDIEDNPAIDAEMFMDPVELHDKMSKIYAPQLTEDDFNKTFEEMEVKFKTSKYEYLLCGEGEVWKKVGDKFKEFISNWGGTKDAITDTGSKIERESMNMVQSAEEFELKYSKNASNKPAGAFKNFMQNTFKTSINQVSPLAGLTEISKEIDKYLPGNQSNNLSSLYTAVSNENERYEFDISIATVKAKYMALYAGTTDAAVKSFTDNLDILLGTLKNTATPVIQLNSCTSKVVGKQCK